MLNWRENVISPIGFWYIPFFFCSFCFDFVIFFFYKIPQISATKWFHDRYWCVFISSVSIFCKWFIRIMFGKFDRLFILIIIKEIFLFFIFRLEISIVLRYMYVIIIWLRESFEAQISHTVSQNRLKQKSVYDFFLNFSFKFNFTLKKKECVNTNKANHYARKSWLFAYL